MRPTQRRTLAIAVPASMRPTQRRTLAMAALATSAAVSLVLLGSCEGSGARGPGGAGTTSGTGAGGSTDVGFFDAAGVGGNAPDGCGGPPPSDAGDDGPTGCEGIEGGVTYVQVASILAGCQGENCHPSPGRADLVGVVASECCDERLLVDPGNAARSYVIDKVEGHDLCQGARMPWALPPLSDADLLTLRRWVCEGAPGP